nr:MAG TPA: hypothetical protein [Caudoviricetes sp.]
MEVTIAVGQTLWDIAISSKGSWEAGIDMARSAGVSMTDQPHPGAVYTVPSKTYDRAMERYALTHRLDPATAGASSISSVRIFSSAFSAEFT